jgi:hypothetical protein
MAAAETNTYVDIHKASLIIEAREAGLKRTGKEDAHERP